MQTLEYVKPNVEQGIPNDGVKSLLLLPSAFFIRYSTRPPKQSVLSFNLCILPQPETTANPGRGYCGGWIPCSLPSSACL